MTRNTLGSAFSEFKPSGFLNVIKIRESVIVGARKNPSKVTKEVGKALMSSGNQREYCKGKM